MKTKRIKMAYVTAFIVIVVIVFVTISIFILKSMRDSHATAVENYIYGSVDFKCDNVSMMLEKDVSAVEDFASFISDYKTLTETQVKIKLNQMNLQHDNVENFILIKENGDVIATNVDKKNVAKRKYFQTAMQGISNLSSSIFSEPDRKMVNIIAVPIYGDYHRVIGVAAAVFDAATYGEDLSVSFGRRNNDGNGYIVDSQGNVLLSGPNNFGEFKPLEDSLYNSAFLSGLSEEDKNSVLDSLARVSGKGIIKSQCNGEAYIGCYIDCPAIPNLHYLLIFPEDVVYERHVEYVKQNTLMYAFFLFILLFTFTAYFLGMRFSLRGLRLANNEISRIAYVDSLTGYSTWDKFVLDATNLLKSEYRKYAFVSFDIDKFKAINDMFGHDEGNRILRMISDTVNRNISDDETFSRINSDNFYMLMQYKSDKDIVERLKALISAIEYEITDFVPVLSIGIYKITDTSMSIRKMGDLADIAKRTIKYGGTSTIAFYNENMLLDMREEKRIENEMQAALDMHEFHVYYQPKVSLSGDVTLSGAEALVRWIKSDGVIIPPGKFVPLFEKNRFIIKLDYYILDRVCQDIKSWQDKYTDFVVSVNMSRVHLKDSHFVEKLTEICKSHGVPTSRIEIEITESAAYESLDVLRGVFAQLKNSGFVISIDDFGSGYSSLNMLKDLPVDVLKIDRAFLVEPDAEGNRRANEILGYVIKMAACLGMQTICEGIETVEQATLLRELGCGMAQGYYFAKPMPRSDFEQILNGDNDNIHISGKFDQGAVSYEYIE